MAELTPRELVYITRQGHEKTVHLPPINPDDYNPPLIMGRVVSRDKSDTERRDAWEADTTRLPGRWWSPTDIRRTTFDPAYYQIRASWDGHLWTYAVPELDVTITARTIGTEQNDWYNKVVHPVENAIFDRYPDIDRVMNFDLICDRVEPIPHLDVELRHIWRESIDDPYPRLRRIAVALLSTGLTPTQIAAIIGVSVQTISTWKRTGTVSSQPM